MKKKLLLALLLMLNMIRITKKKNHVKNCPRKRLTKKRCSKATISRSAVSSLFSFSDTSEN